MRLVSTLLVAAAFCACSSSSATSTTSSGTSSSSSSSGSSGASSSSSSGGSSSSGSSSGSSSSSSSSSSGSTTPIGALQHGVATYYAATGAGDCSFDATPGDLDVAAMDAPEYATAAACGECVAITGPKGAVTVRIVDKCPECEAGHLDLSQSAFAKIADVSAGRVTIAWQVVPCAVTGPVSYYYKDSSSQYWTAIQVRNHRLPITKLEIQKAGVFTDIARVDYNYFVDAQGAGTGPVTVRITAEDGQALIDTLPAVTASTAAPGAAQFK